MPACATLLCVLQPLAMTSHAPEQRAGIELAYGVSDRLNDASSLNDLYFADIRVSTRVLPWLGFDARLSMARVETTGSEPDDGFGNLTLEARGFHAFSPTLDASFSAGVSLPTLTGVRLWRSPTHDAHSHWLTRPPALDEPIDVAVHAGASLRLHDGRAFGQLQADASLVDDDAYPDEDTYVSLRLAAGGGYALHRHIALVGELAAIGNDFVDGHAALDLGVRLQLPLGDARVTLVPRVYIPLTDADLGYGTQPGPSPGVDLFVAY